jgi:dipeptidase
MAGKKATCDGTILLSRNEDYKQQNDWKKYMVFRPFLEYYKKQDVNTAVSDDVCTLGNGLIVPVPQKMYRYNAILDTVVYEEAAYAI